VKVATVGLVPIGNNNVDAVELDQLACLLRSVRHHDRIEAPAPQYVRQPHGSPEGFLVG
jgi:hypothetical protein